MDALVFQKNQEPIQQVAVEVRFLDGHDHHSLVNIDNRRTDQAIFPFVNFEDITFGIFLCREIYPVPNVGRVAFFTEIPTRARLIDLAITLYIVEACQGFNNLSLHLRALVL